MRFGHRLGLQGGEILLNVGTGEQWNLPPRFRRERRVNIEANLLKRSR
jgi:hypothetical protein